MSETGETAAKLRAVPSVSLPGGASSSEIADFFRGLAILDDVTQRARRVAERLEEEEGKADDAS